MTRLDIRAKTTSTGASIDATGVDISAITGDWTLVLEVLAQNDGNVTRFVFEDSNNSFTTYNTDIFPGPAFSVTGKITSSYPKRFSVKKADFPMFGAGVASTFGRLNLAQMTGSSKSVTYHAYIEY